MRTIVSRQSTLVKETAAAYLALRFACVVMVTETGVFLQKHNGRECHIGLCSTLVTNRQVLCTYVFKVLNLLLNKMDTI